MRKISGHFFLSKLLFILLFFFVFFNINYLYGKAVIKRVNANVPSPVYLAPCPTCSVPTIYLEPSASLSPGNSGNSTSPRPSSIAVSPVSQQNPSPVVNPCTTSGHSVTSQSTGTVQAMRYSRGHHRGKWHYSGGQGWIQQFIQFLLQLLQLIFKQLGIDLPVTTTPCPSPSPAAAVPSSAEPSSVVPSSAVPSSGNVNGGGSGSAPSPTISKKASPSTSNPAPSSTTNSLKPYGNISGNWTLKFDDEFNGTSLDTSKWSTGWFGSGITAPVNSSAQGCYDPAQVSEAGGSLNLTIIKKSESCGGTTRPYATGAVTTDGKFSYTYGFTEARVWLPGVNGSLSEIANWPAVWTDGQSWPTDGEDDILEGLSGRACYHFHDPSGGPGGCVSGNFAGGWHIFASNWQPGSVTYYYDGKKVGTITSGITSAPMYIILVNEVANLIQPDTMKIDYIRIWQ